MPILESTGSEFGEWVSPAPINGVLSLPYYALGPTGEAFTTAVGLGGWLIVGFGWGTWMATDEGAALRDQPATMSSATPDDLARLLTAIVRSDRFVEGSIAGAFESGLLARIARRAAALLAELQDPVPTAHDEHIRAPAEG